MWNSTTRPCTSSRHSPVILSLCTRIEPFYEHTNDSYIDVLVHLDDTFHENGEIRFLAGSHKLGALQHVTQTDDGPCSPHLPTDLYKLEETVRLANAATW